MDCLEGLGDFLQVMREEMGDLRKRLSAVEADLQHQRTRNMREGHVPPVVLSPACLPAAPGSRVPQSQVAPETIPETLGEEVGPTPEVERPSDTARYDDDDDVVEPTMPPSPSATGGAFQLLDVDHKMSTAKDKIQDTLEHAAQAPFSSVQPEGDRTTPPKFEKSAKKRSPKFQPQPFAVEDPTHRGPDSNLSGRLSPIPGKREPVKDTATKVTRKKRRRPVPNELWGKKLTPPKEPSKWETLPCSDGQENSKFQNSHSKKTRSATKPLRQWSLNKMVSSKEPELGSTIAKKPRGFKEIGKSNPVIRGKEARAALKAVTCKDCEDGFRAIADGDEAKYRRLVQTACKHRYQHTPPNHGDWMMREIAFPETETEAPSSQNENIDHGLV